MVNINSIKIDDVVVDGEGNKYFVREIYYHSTFATPYLLKLTNCKTQKVKYSSFTKEGQFYEDRTSSVDIVEVIPKYPLYVKKLPKIKSETFGEF